MKQTEIIKKIKADFVTAIKMEKWNKSRNNDLSAQSWTGRALALTELYAFIKGIEWADANTYLINYYYKVKDAD